MTEIGLIMDLLANADDIMTEMIYQRNINHRSVLDCRNTQYGLV